MNLHMPLYILPTSTKHQHFYFCFIYAFMHDLMHDFIYRCTFEHISLYAFYLLLQNTQVSFIGLFCKRNLSAHSYNTQGRTAVHFKWVRVCVIVYECADTGDWEWDACKDKHTRIYTHTYIHIRYLHPRVTINIHVYTYTVCRSGMRVKTNIHLYTYTLSATPRGGGLGSRPIFKKFN